MKFSSEQSRTSVSEAYGAFAYAYDKALGERFFRSAKKLLDENLAKYPPVTRTHLDVACGTGLAVEHFRARGFKSIGLDASLPMLRVGVVRASGAPFIAADMRALPFRTTFARITCLYDSLNHLLEHDELIAAFKAMRAVMDHDSLLLFDMNHPDIYPEIWGTAEPFIASGPDYHLEMATSYRKRDRLARAIVTGWATIRGERVAMSELRHQRAYTKREILSALSESQLEPLEVSDFDPYHEASSVEAETVKLFFVCAPVAERRRPGG